MLYNIALLISAITWIYLFIHSFRTGCLWPILILIFGPISILLYVILSYDGNKLGALVAFYAPLIVSLVARYGLGYTA